jgi:hypothetical protein
MKKSVKKVEEVKNELQVANFTPKEEKVIINLTPKEEIVLNALIDSLTAEAGFSDIDCNDLSQSTKLPVATVKALVGSLTKKELVFTDKTTTSGAKHYDLIYLAPFAWILHPEWKEEAEHAIEVNVIQDLSVDKLVKVDKIKKSVVKSMNDSDDKSFDNFKGEESKVNKPYGVYGKHGENIEIENFKRGDLISFTAGDKNMVGEFVHFHVNNWSKKGYAVIKSEGKIYERVLANISKFKEVKKASKKTVEVKTTTLKKKLQK